MISPLIRRELFNQLWIGNMCRFSEILSICTGNVYFAIWPEKNLFWKWCSMAGFREDGSASAQFQLVIPQHTALEYTMFFLYWGFMLFHTVCRSCFPPFFSKFDQTGYTKWQGNSKPPKGISPQINLSHIHSIGEISMVAGAQCLADSISPIGYKCSYAQANLLLLSNSS